MSTTKRTSKSPEQVSNENIIVGWFAFVAIGVAVLAGMASHTSVDHAASRQAVDQVQGGAR